VVTNNQLLGNLQDLLKGNCDAEGAMLIEVTVPLGFD